MRHYHFCAALAALATISPACAAPVEGFRVALRAGVDHVDYSNSDLNLSIDKTGYMFGGSVGYDWLVGKRWLVGIETGIDFIETTKCVTVFGNDRGCADSRRDFDVVGQVGILATPRLIAFAEAGYVSGRVAMQYTNEVNPQAGFQTTASGDGVRLGAGLRYQMARDFYGEIKYRYSNYEDGFIRNQGVISLGMRF